MAIIKYTKDATIKYAYLNIFPDQFKTEKEKTDEGWIKNTMDYFSNKAYSQYIENRKSFVKNYELLKGILRKEDFYQSDIDEVKSFTEMLTDNSKLPSYVKHYSILTTPINELVGEVSKRPDTYRIKAFDDDSKSEELQFKTETLQKFIIEQAKQKIIQKAELEGEEIKEDELQQMTMEQVKDQLDSYTSIAEKWGNHTLTCLKAEFNLKEKSEDAFRDLLISNKEYFHIYEDNSKLGFNIEVSNPKNTWHLSTPDKKYISDPSGRNQGAYAAGTVQVMELSEIIESFPDLTKEEIVHLRSSLNEYGLLDVRESNLGNPNITPGINSITYDTYDRLALQERMIIESEIKDNNNDGLEDFLGLSNNVSAFGYKYIVMKSYWISKRKIGKLVYLDELGNEQTIIVDESYKSGIISTQQSLEWGWVNQWYQGTRIGTDVYHVKPFDLLPYCPIIGMVHEIKNTESRSLVDLMKPFQTIYNIAINQLYELLEKEIGNIANLNIRRIPTPKDGNSEDAIDMWEVNAKQRGISFDDDSPENTKAPITNQSVARNIDLTRTQEIQSRYNLAQQMKNECWELIGMSRQRMGSISASETATGTNTAMQQSYSQTEPLFVAHEYVIGQLYQSIVDAALFVESNKEQSTLSYITSEGESAFVKVNGTDLKLRDLKVFPTNRPEDTQMFNELRQLSQAIIQNGGTIYDIVELYSTKSMRQMKKTFKDLRDRQIEQQQQSQQLEQQKVEQQQKQFEAQLQEQQRIKSENNAREDYNKELDRANNKEIAIIKATGFGQVESEDINNNVVPDVLEASKIANEEAKAIREYQTKLTDINSRNSIANRKLKIEEDKNQIARDNMANDERIAKINASNKKA